MDLNEIIKGLLTEMRSMSGSESVVGKPITVGDATIVPVCKISLGFGTGMTEGGGRGQRSEGNFEGGGAGGGVGVEPLAFLVVDKSGHAQLLSLKGNKEGVIGRALDLVPEVVDKFLGDGGNGPVQVGAPREKAPKKS